MNRRTTKILDLLFADGEWIRLPKILIRKLQPGEALFLAYLLNERYKFQSEERNDKYEGVFFFSVNKVLRDMGMTKDQQQWYRRSLVQKGIITVYTKHPTIKSTPKHQRYIEINTSKLVEFLTDEEYQGVVATP